MDKIIKVDQLGDSLKRERKERHLTATDLAKQLGTTQQTVSRWEAGATPSGKFISAISEEFGWKVTGYEEATRPLMDLPLNGFTHDDFEEFCKDLASKSGYPNAYIYGGKGDAQFGIDVICDDETVIQCKQVKRRQFGPQKVESVDKVYTKGGRNDKRKILALSKRASRAELTKARELGWEIWDAEKLSSMAVQLNTVDRSYLYRKFYAGDLRVMRDCLGLDRMSPFEDKKSYLERDDSPNGVFFHGHNYVERDDVSIESIVQCIDEPGILTICGEHGSGRTRIVREILGKINCDTYILSGLSDMSSNDVDDLPDGSLLVVDVDDNIANIVGRLLHQLVLGNKSGMRIIVVTTPDVLRQTQLVIPREYKYNNVCLKKLSISKRIKIAKSILDGCDNDKDAVDIAANRIVDVCGGNLPLLVTGCNLIAKNNLNIRGAFNDGRFIREINTSLTKLYVNDCRVSQSDQSTVIGILSLIEPVNKTQASGIISRISKLMNCYVSEDVVSTVIDYYISSGVILCGASGLTIAVKPLSSLACIEFLLRSRETLLQFVDNIKDSNVQDHAIINAVVAQQRMNGMDVSDKLEYQIGAAIDMVLRDACESLEDRIDSLSYALTVRPVSIVNIAQNELKGNCPNITLLQKISPLVRAVVYDNEYFTVALQCLIDIAVKLCKENIDNRESRAMGELSQLIPEIALDPSRNNFVITAISQHGEVDELLANYYKTNYSYAGNGDKFGMEWCFRELKYEEVKTARSVVTNIFLSRMESSNDVIAIKAATNIHNAFFGDDKWGDEWRADRVALLLQVKDKVARNCFNQLCLMPLHEYCARIVNVCRIRDDNDSVADTALEVIRTIKENGDKKYLIAACLVNSYGSLITDDVTGTDKANRSVAWMEQKTAELLSKYDKGYDLLLKDIDNIANKIQKFDPNVYYLINLVMERSKDVCKTALNGRYAGYAVAHLVKDYNERELANPKKIASIIDSEGEESISALSEIISRCTNASDESILDVARVLLELRNATALKSVIGNAGRRLSDKDLAYRIINLIPLYYDHLDSQSLEVLTNLIYINLDIKMLSNEMIGLIDKSIVDSKDNLSNGACEYLKYLADNDIERFWGVVERRLLFVSKLDGHINPIPYYSRVQIKDIDSERVLDCVVKLCDKCGEDVRLKYELYSIMDRYLMFCHDDLADYIKSSIVSARLSPTAVKVLIHGLRQCYIWDYCDDIKQILDNFDNTGSFNGELCKSFMDGLLSLALDGAKTLDGPGRASQEDLNVRAKVKAILDVNNMPKWTTVYRLYDRIYKSVDYNIKRDEEMVW